MPILVPEAELNACKTDSERLMAGLNALDKEFDKKLEARKADDMAATKKLVDDALLGHQTRMGELFPQFRMPGLEAGSVKDKNKFSVVRAATAFRHRDASYGPLEMDVYESKEHREFIAKAAALNSDVSGGFLIPTEVSQTLIDKLQPATVAFQAGVRQFDVGQAAALTFNRLIGNATATWVGEMITASKSDLQYSQYTVAPKALSAKTDLSNMLQLMGSNVAEERWLDNAGLMFAQGIDRGVLIGPATVTNAAPIGIAGTQGVLTAPSASLSYDLIVDFEDKLRQANAFFGRIAWVMSESQYTVVRKLKDTAGQPIVYRSLTEKGLTELFGLPIYRTTQMGTTGANTLALGAWNQATLFSWFGGVLMKRSDTSDTALDTDVTRLTLRRYCDVGVDQPTAFVFAST